MDLLGPIERPRLLSEAIARFHRLIDQRCFEPSDRFPSERELAMYLGVSRKSVREALQVLKVFDLIEVRHG